MRVLLASHTPLDGSGSGIYLRKVAERLLALGHEVATLCPAGSTVEELPFRQEVIGTPARPGRWNLPFPFPSFSGHRDSSLLYEELSADDIAVYLDVWTTALRDLAKDFGADVLHVNHAFLIAYAAARIPELPYVVVSHGSEFFRDSGSAFGSYQRAGLRGARGLVAITPGIGGLMSEAAGCAPDRVHIVSPGFDPDVFRPRDVDRDAVLRSYGLSGGRPCVAYVGRHVRYKRVPDLLAALAALPAAERPQALVVGDGPALDEAKEAARRLALPDTVFAGHVGDPDRIARLLAALDLLVLPSENDPYPMTAIEALACGTPVLTSDRCGVTDIVADVAGAVYPTGDTRALAALLREAVHDDWKTARGPQGPARVAAKTWQALTARLLDVYTRAAGAPAPSGATPHHTDEAEQCTT
ncbi:glycosyltransferase family 4 protein [Streptomyces sp. NPDC004561]